MALRHRSSQIENLQEKLEELRASDDAAGRFERYADRPVSFVQEVLGAEPEPYQTEILSAAAEEERIAWRAAHGVGKTTTLAWVLTWFLLSRPFSRVLMVAPAFERQIGRYLLPEVRKWERHAPVELPLKIQAESVEVAGYEKEWSALAVQASDPGKIEGGHARHMAVLADEAKALPQEAVAALHGTQTDPDGDRLYMLTSVPGGPSGPFYDAFHSGLWRTFHTSAHDSDRVSDTWIGERRQEWGEGSSLFVARVLGDFPEEEEGTLFRLSELEAAVDRTLDTHSLDQDQLPLRLGVDVARHGHDRSALAIWRGPRLVDLSTRRGDDTMETASWVASEINRREPDRVLVDEIGIGSGVVDRLKQLGHSAVVRGIKVSEKADSDVHVNRKAEMFWELRQALERGDVSLPPDSDSLIAELTAIRYEYTKRGQIRLETKDETKSRLGRSPDLADAVALGFGGTSAGSRLDPGIDRIRTADEILDGVDRSGWQPIRGMPGFYRDAEGRVRDQDGGFWGLWDGDE